MSNTTGNLMSDAIGGNSGEKTRISNHSEFISVEDAARRLGITRQTLLRLINRKEAPGIRIGRQWRIRQVDFEKWITVGGDWKGMVE